MNESDMNFIRINGFLYVLTRDGRFRKNWRNDVNRKQGLNKVSRVGVCEHCGISGRLTIDHDPPLRETTNNKHRLLCQECHSEKNRMESKSGMTFVGGAIKSCGKGHHTYLVGKDIVCKKCNRTLTKLVQIKGEYFIAKPNLVVKKK